MGRFVVEICFIWRGMCGSPFDDFDYIGFLKKDELSPMQGEREAIQDIAGRPRIRDQEDDGRPRPGEGLPVAPIPAGVKEDRVEVQSGEK